LRIRFLALAFVLLIIDLPCARATAAESVCACSNTQQKRSTPTHPACGNLAEAKCELKRGQGYLGLRLWPDAMKHCATALVLAGSLKDSQLCYIKAENNLLREREYLIVERLKLVDSLIAQQAWTAADRELTSLSAFESLESKRLGPLTVEGIGLIDAARARLASAQQQQWPALLPSVLRDWLPAVLRAALRTIAYLLLFLILWGILTLLRERWRGYRWRNIDGPIEWSVSSIADETKQLAAGAVMDALNVYHNPLFQPLSTSSFLAMPPALAEDEGYIAGPSFVIWRNFLLRPVEDMVRPYLSDLIEFIDIEKFTRHSFRQVDAFDDINLKLGTVEASLGAIFRNLRRWWTKGWPTVTGSVVIEQVGGSSFASVRILCNYGLKGADYQNEPLAPQNADVEPGALLRNERTLAVFASTRVDEFTDAVALASQRAAFRLLYRLAKRPAEPNLAISASSYRQGVRLLLNVL